MGVVIGGAPLKPDKTRLLPDGLVPGTVMGTDEIAKRAGRST
jgi:hypothetical protein